MQGSTVLYLLGDRSWKISSSEPLKVKASCSLARCMISSFILKSMKQQRLAGDHLLCLAVSVPYEAVLVPLKSPAGLKEEKGWPHTTIELDPIILYLSNVRIRSTQDR